MPRKPEAPSIPPRGVLLESMDCPAWLNREGKRRWWGLAPLIAAMHGGLTPKLADQLGRAVAAHQRWIAAYRARSARGDFGRQTRKGFRMWPEYVAEMKASRTFWHLAQQLGLTPLARKRILARRRRPPCRPA